MTHYITINGPRHSGRSTLARMLNHRLKGSMRMELHTPIKQLFCTGLGMEWERLDNDHMRSSLNGRSTIAAMKQLRLHLRGVYGPSVLGDWLCHRVLGMDPKPDIVIVDDVLYLDDLIPFESNTTVRIIRGDENNFVPLSNPMYTVINGSGMSYLEKRADQIVGGLNAKERND